VIICAKSKRCSKEIYYSMTYNPVSESKGNQRVFKKLFELKDDGLVAYKNSHHAGQLLIRGDPKNPDYWLDCTAEVTGNGYSHCEAEFDYDDKIIVEYLFNRTILLKEHEQLREKVIDLINNFKEQRG
ncbi:MAG: hypothetical protein ACHP9Y_06550, partial [Gammaproteobacteria bacterium]